MKKPAKRIRAVKPKSDQVNHPRHYTSHPSGVECIDIVEHMSFNDGSAVAYLWRAGMKGGAIDREKAAWYALRENARLAKMKQAAKRPVNTQHKNKR